jgi:hypothetical protein
MLESKVEAKIGTNAAGRNVQVDCAQRRESYSFVCTKAQMVFDLGKLARTGLQNLKRGSVGGNTTQPVNRGEELADKGRLVVLLYD